MAKPDPKQPSAAAVEAARDWEQSQHPGDWCEDDVIRLAAMIQRVSDAEVAAERQVVEWVREEMADGDRRLYDKLWDAAKTRESQNSELWVLLEDMAKWLREGCVEAERYDEDGNEKEVRLCARCGALIARCDALRPADKTENPSTLPGCDSYTPSVAGDSGTLCKTCGWSANAHAPKRGAS